MIQKSVQYAPQLNRALRL